MWELARKLGILVLTVSVVLSFGNPRGETKKGNSSYQSPSPLPWFQPFLFSIRDQLPSQHSSSLEYDFYREKCPHAEQIVRSTMRQLFSDRPSIAPALLRLVFHDCFIQGCDASVLLDKVKGDNSEKDAIPNKSLKGFDFIDIIKAKLEEACPVTVSCADIVVLAAREGIVLAGGPFYPLFTGRRDSTKYFWDLATNELPSPSHNISQTLASFGKRGFNERETVSLFGGHSIGTVHCKFFKDRLYDFRKSGMPDNSIDPGFLLFIRKRCMEKRNNINTSALPEDDTEPGMNMDEERQPSGFDTHYFRSLLQGRGILFADQQLMAHEKTAELVKAYASDSSAFRRDFGRVMIKLSGLNVLSGSQGQVRRNCSMVLP
ncbi:putative Peroxidase 48 [Tasmannia lanceolata]|uniref:putative Peroxidase 48 n=1 Tax=Tasmannia lanceolata TaxID=3420 RepID=UPI00406393B9